MIVGRLLYIHLQASFPDGDVDCGGNVLWCSEWLQKSIHYKNGLYILMKDYKDVFSLWQMV